MPFRYPVALELSGRRGVVVGGDGVAEGRARGLLEAGAAVAVVAAEVTPGLADLGRRSELEIIPRPYRAGDLDGAFLVVSCEPARNAEVYADADAAGVLCNAVDDTAQCHFAMPSIVRRGDLIVAVSTGGRSPALAKRLRRQLSARYGWEYEALVEMLGTIRTAALGARTGDFATWADRWSAVLDEEDELVGLIRQGRLEEVAARVWAHLEGAPNNAVELLSAGPRL